VKLEAAAGAERSRSKACTRLLKKSFPNFAEICARQVYAGSFQTFDRPPTPCSGLFLFNFEILRAEADLSKLYFATTFLSSSLTCPATQSGLCGEEVAPATCGLAHAQQGDRVRRMGVLMVQAAEDPEGQARLAESGSRRSSVNSA
jgi:hypothetical protein